MSTVALAISPRTPYVLIVRKGLFLSFKLQAQPSQVKLLFRVTQVLRAICFPLI